MANRLRWKGFATVEMECNSLEKIRSCMVVLCGQTLLHRGIIAISLEELVDTDRSTKTVNVSTSNDLQYTVIYCIKLCQVHQFWTMYQTIKLYTRVRAYPFTGLDYCLDKFLCLFLERSILIFSFKLSRSFLHSLLDFSSLVVYGWL